MHEAILEELGLMPLWQLRQKSVAAGNVTVANESMVDGELTVVTVRREDGAPGWIVMAEPLAEEAAALFVNMLRAMRLQQIESRPLAHAQLSDVARQSAMEWVWLMGDCAVQRVLELQGGVARLPQQALQWQHLPVFVSEHPRALLLRPQDKAGVWAGWCQWLLNQ